MSGVAALADAMPGMTALAKLDISSNYIGAEQEEDLQRVCNAGGIELAPRNSTQKKEKKFATPF
jgi:hypothetical protein